MITMTVKQLREALEKFPDDMPVQTEGCDCYGDAGSLILEGDHVLISRAFPGVLKSAEEINRENAEANAKLLAENPLLT